MTDNVKNELDDSGIESKMPVPVGYKILCAVPSVEKTFEGGILKAESTISREEILSSVLLVLELGPDCYKEEEKFHGKAYCKQGDYVLVRPNAGTRFMIGNQEFRLINDDSVEAVVADPRAIRRK